MDIFLIHPKQQHWKLFDLCTTRISFKIIFWTRWSDIRDCCKSSFFRWGSTHRPWDWPRLRGERRSCDSSRPARWFRYWRFKRESFAPCSVYFRIWSPLKERGGAEKGNGNLRQWSSFWEIQSHCSRPRGIQNPQNSSLYAHLHRSKKWQDSVYW